MGDVDIKINNARTGIVVFPTNIDHDGSFFFEKFRASFPDCNVCFEPAGYNTQGACKNRLQHTGVARTQCLGMLRNVD